MTLANIVYFLSNVLLVVIGLITPQIKKFILYVKNTMEQSEGNTVLKMMRELLRWLNEKNYPFRRLILLEDGKYCHGPLLSFLSTHNVDYIVRAYPSMISKKLGAELVENKLINHDFVLDLNICCNAVVTLAIIFIFIFLLIYGF
ncbi:MAG: hypothetical protein ACTSRR_13710 [Candidatus Heimdallarchaeaceae archaeon]